LHAFEVLMSRYQPALAGFLFGRVHDKDDAEDLAQEIWIYVYRTIGRLRRPDRFGPWLFRIARGLTVDFYRRRVAAPVIVELDPSMLSSDDPGASAAEQQLQEVLLKCLSEIPERYRSVLYLRLIEEWSATEIAALLDLKGGAVRMRLLRGLKMLPSRLEHRGLHRIENIGLGFGRKRP
jgi:RNA polymerase sigma-70 factor (ECF subfamily)